MQRLTKAHSQRPASPHPPLPPTPRALERYEEAITHYLERIPLGGWDEECFMSALSIADMTKIAFQEGKLISKQVLGVPQGKGPTACLHLIAGRT